MSQKLGGIPGNHIKNHQSSRPSELPLLGDGELGEVALGQAQPELGELESSSHES